MGIGAVSVAVAVSTLSGGVRQLIVKIVEGLRTTSEKIRARTTLVGQCLKDHGNGELQWLRQLG